MIGQTVSHYKILEKLGEGGMGVVYKARDLKLDRFVALKFLPPRVASSEQELARFQQEAKAISALNHTNIATIYDVDEADGERFLVIEYLPGGTLKSHIGNLQSSGRELSLTQILEYGLQIAEGLAHAHQNGIVHRDVKTDNMMFTKEGRLKITDFGLAKLRGGAQLTKTGSTVGTAAYMSPEQIRGEELDHRSDLFSFGIVLYELITGHLPFRGEHEAALGYSIVNEDPIPLSTFRPTIPPSFEKVISRCLEKEREKRYQSAEELINDLDLILAEKRQPAASRSVLVFRNKIAKYRSRILVSLAFFTLVFLVTMLILLKPGSVESTKGVSRTAVVVLPFSVRGSPELNYLGEGMVNLLSTKLDGAGELRSVDPRALSSFVAREVGPTVDLGEGLKVAKHFGAAFYVMGDIIEIGRKLQINATLYSWGDGISENGRGTASGEVGKLFDMVDDVATQLLIRISGERGQPSARVEQLAAVTTSSLSAFKAYLEGENAMRDGRYEEALTAFQRAVTEDTTFALGYYRLSIAAEWTLRGNLAHEMAKYAFRHAARFSDRDSRLFEALLAYRQGEALKAEELYRRIVGTHPDDVEAWMQLGEVLFHYIPLHARSSTESREAFEKVLFYEPDHAGALVHLARLAAQNGNTAELDSFTQRYETLNPQGDRALPMRALQVFTQGTQKAEQEILAQLESASDATVALAAWEVLVSGRNLRGAEKIFPLLTTSAWSAEVRVAAHVWLAHIAIARGQWNVAKRELSLVEPLDRATFLEYSAILSCLPVFSVNVNKSELVSLHVALRKLDAAQVPPNSNPAFFFSPHNGLHSILRMYLLGVLSGRLGETSEALQYSRKVETLTPPPGAGSLATDFGFSIKAQVEMSRGRDAEALAILARTRRATWYELAIGSPFYSQAYERFLRAELLFKIKNYQEALRWYKTIMASSVFEVAYLSLSYYRLGQISERLGDVSAAIDYYGKFVELWKECDVEFRLMLVDAQKRIEQLSEKS